MVDKDKVLKGLECHRNGFCSFCPYDDGSILTTFCKRQLLEDIIEVLKEQPEQKHGHWIEYPKCLEYDGALDDTYIVCSACEHVFNVIDNCTELFDYCPKCGAKMNEENEKEK